MNIKCFESWIFSLDIWSKHHWILLTENRQLLLQALMFSRYYIEFHHQVLQLFLTHWFSSLINFLWWRFPSKSKHRRFSPVWMSMWIILWNLNIHVAPKVSYVIMCDLRLYSQQVWVRIPSRSEPRFESLVVIVFQLVNYLWWFY